jgi:hypothetical protein
MEAIMAAITGKGAAGGITVEMTEITTRPVQCVK